MGFVWHVVSAAKTLREKPGGFLVRIPQSTDRGSER